MHEALRLRQPISSTAESTFRGSTRQTHSCAPNTRPECGPLERRGSTLKRADISADAHLEPGETALPLGASDYPLGFLKHTLGPILTLLAFVSASTGLGCNIGAQPELPEHPRGPVFDASDESVGEPSPLAPAAPGAQAPFIDASLVLAERVPQGARFDGLAGALERFPDEGPDGTVTSESAVVYAVALGDTRQPFEPAEDGSFTVTLEQEELPDTFEVVFTATQLGQPLAQARFFVDLETGSLTPLFLLPGPSDKDEDEDEDEENSETPSPNPET